MPKVVTHNGQLVTLGGKVLEVDATDTPLITVDSELSSTSENPVQNKVVTAALAEKITAPTTAAVGQIIKVKSVDDTGKPTEWEAADNGRTLKLIANVTTAEETSMIAITKDSAGGDYAIKSWAIYINIPAHERDTAKTFYARAIGFGGGLKFTNMLTNQNREMGLFVYPIANYDAQDAIGENHAVAVQSVSSYGGNLYETQTGFTTHISILQVYTNDAAVLFPAGTNVKLWGIKI